MVEVWTSVRWEAFLAKVYPHEISNVEYHGLLVDVDLGREALYLAFDGVPCIFMHLLEIVHSCTLVVEEVRCPMGTTG